MPKATEQRPQIPLICSLCPKCPQFSDVSHLLTHVSSKSHLSHKFNLEVLSQNDQQIFYQLQGYNNWYNNYGIARLLGERMSTKGNKKNNVKRQKTNSNKMKREQVDIKSENIHPALYAQPATQAYRPPMPLMQSIAAAPMNHHPWTGSYNTNHSTPAPRSEWGDDSPYDTPTMSNYVPNFAPMQPQPHPAVEDIVSKNMYDDTEDDEEEEEDAHRVSHASQLKGVRWPGMGLFDSATPEMKRRRNQKKDGSILEGMKLTSLSTEPTEVIYNRDGGFKRSKPIYGHSDSEDESLESVAPTPVTRRSRKANALKKVDGNAPRFRKSSRTNASKNLAHRTRSDMTIFKDEATLDDFNNNSFAFGTTSRSASSYTTSSTGASKYEPSVGEDEGFSSFNRKIKPAKKSKIKVLRDDERISAENVEEVSPGRTESTLEEHRFDDFQSDIYQSVPTRQTLTSPTPSYRQTLGNGRHYPFNRTTGRSREFSDKENVVPEGRFMAERETFRYTADYGHAYPPSQQYFHEAATINPLRSQLQVQHPLQYRDYPYAYSDSNGYAGDFKPVGDGPSQYHSPLPSYLTGGSSSAGHDAALLTPTQDGNNTYYT